MRFVIAFLALVGLAVAIEGPLAVKCGQKNKYVVQSVNDFCKKTNLVVPSDYADSGSRTNRFAIVDISGTCNPPQWVPAKICKTQFFNMCINGDKLGQNVKRFGRNNCQAWEIFASKSQNANAPANPDAGKKISQGTWKGLFKTLGWRKRDVEDLTDHFDETSAEELGVTGSE